ncbi:MAG: hypothetical protein ACOC54_04645, partial [Candidatus Sumerlaeota bacterium]
MPEAPEKQTDDTQNNGDPIGWKPVIKVILMLLIMVACIVVIKALHLDAHFRDPEWRRDMQDRMGAWLPLIYLAAGTIIIAVGAPRVWYSFLGGALFGFTMGTIW